MIRIEVNSNGHYYSNNISGVIGNHQHQHNSVVRKNAIQNPAKVHLSEDLHVPKVKS